jgi:hypothetical protein
MSNKQYVCGFYFSQQAVLLMERKRPEDQEGLLNGVGGRVRTESGESAYDAMGRHWAAQTGLAHLAPRWERVAIGTYPNGDTVVFYRGGGIMRLISTPPTDEHPLWVGLRGHAPEAGPKAKLMPDLHWLIPLARSPGRALLPVVFTLDFPRDND